MKVLKKILAFCLVFVTLFCSFSIFALADGEGYTYTGDSFWGWLLGNNTPDWLDSVVGFISPEYCEKSPNHFHTANSYLRKTNFWESVGSLGVYDYECQCEYCGDTFYVSQKNVTEIFYDSYDSYVNDTLKEELGTTVVGKNGFQIPLYFTDEDSFDYTYDLGTVTRNVIKEKSASFDLLALPVYGFVVSKSSPSSSCSLKAPVDGYYSIGYSCELNNLTSERLVSTGKKAALTGTELGTLFRNNTYLSAWALVRLTFIDTSLIATYSLTAWINVEPYTYSVDDFTQEVGGIDGRPTSFTGDLGIMGDNGTLTKVEGDQIFNETTNYYHNPVTNNTTNITDWTYDYSDRSYNLTTEEGDTITVTYGDENITIQEGDQTYNVYYVIVNESGGSQGGGGEGTDPTHTHSWGEPTDSTPPTCTAPGSKTYTCSECGETKTETVPATGHKWVVKENVPTKYDEDGQLVQEGYTIYECSVCGEQYKSTDGTGPPGGGGSPGSGSGGGTEDDDGDSIWDKLGHLLGSLGSSLLELIGAVVGKLLDGLISLADMIAEKLLDVVNLVLSWFDEIPKLFSGFLGFLTAIFPFLPPDIMLLLTFGIAAIVFIGIIKAVRR